MIKAVSLSLGFICLLAPVTGISQSTSAEDAAINQAVLNQANTLVLRQKLVDAQNTANRGDVAGAAKLYEDAYSLVEQIGSGIDAETAQTVSGLTATRMELAREAQGRGNLLEADKQITRVLKVNPTNAAAMAFKRQNDQMIAAQTGTVPDPATLETVPAVAKQKTDAATLVQDGKLLYEMGKLDEADVKLTQALALAPDNRAALYYLNLVKQTRFSRSESRTTLANSDRMVQVQRAWDKPLSGVALTDANPYATNTLIYTGPGRQAIVDKLDRIRLDTVMYDGLPLSEVIRNLSEQAKLRDPDKKGINFLINPNAEAAESGSTAFTPGGGGGFPGQQAAVDPATGLPITNPSANGGGDQVDVGSVIIKINPALSDVRLADVLDAIVQVADHPIKYSITDYAIVFSSRGPQNAQLTMRTFRVDPNTFYSGLESVSSSSFGSAGGSSGGSGGSSGGSGGGSSGGSSGGNNNVGSVIAVVNASPGAGGLRSSGGSGGGGGGGGGGQESQSLLSNPGTTGAGGAGGRGGGGGGTTGGGGLAFITRQTSAATPSELARQFFSSLGVNMDNPPGKAVFFNDRLGLLFVKATDQDLDTIERAIQALNQVAPQVHIKARFIELSQTDDKALGFDWYLGQFGSGAVVAQGGTAPSLNVPAAGGSVQAFPGPTTASAVASSATDQLITGGLRNTLGAPAIATVTGILTDPNFRMVINALQQRSGVETLAEPEATTTSGRQVQMRATELQTIVTGVSFQQGAVGGTGTTTP